MGTVLLDIPKRRCKTVEVSQEVLLTLLKSLDGVSCLKCEGVPDDAVPMGLWVDSMNGAVFLLVESREFPEVEPGDGWPTLRPTIAVVTPTWRDQSPLL